MEYVTAAGVRVPQIGLGTFELTGRVCARTVELALRAGYRLVDTAEHYGNEREVGDAIRASGVKRSEVFVTTKVWRENLSARDFERATKASLARLRMSEVDLLLIHWPNPRVPLAETIGALCRMKTAGYARAVGVSNFTVALLDQAVAHATERLAVNQIEWHALIDQTKVLDACRRHGLAVVAHSPMAQGRALRDTAVKEIAAARGVTPAQVCLRFVLQQGGIVIPRSTRLDRLTENLGALAFALTDEEMIAIRKAARPDGRVVDWAGAPAWD